MRTLGVGRGMSSSSLRRSFKLKRVKKNIRGQSRVFFLNGQMNKTVLMILFVTFQDYCPTFFTCGGSYCSP